MVNKLVERVNEKIMRGKLLQVTSECGASQIMNAIIPEKINTEDNEIYIEGENLVVHISNKEEYNIIFDEMEDEFIIKQGNVTYYLS